MPEDDEPKYPDPREEDIVYEDRRISRPDASLPDWYVPDTAYRPIPIAWFAAAIVIQTVAISAIWFVLINKSGWLTIALSAFASVLIFVWSWERGIKTAGMGWQAATVIVMLLQLLLISVGVSDRL